jgi:hypothetical protein
MNSIITTCYTQLPSMLFVCTLFFPMNDILSHILYINSLVRLSVCLCPSIRLSICSSICDEGFGSLVNLHVTGVRVVVAERHT